MANQYNVSNQLINNNHQSRNGVIINGVISMAIISIINGENNININNHQWQYQWRNGVIISKMNNKASMAWRNQYYQRINVAYVA
jgi:hypothetical protein